MMKKLVLVCCILFIIPFSSLAYAVELIPGGHSIGITMHADGVIVAGFHPVTAGESSGSPAEEAGIQVGDRISKIEQQKVKNAGDVNRVLAGVKPDQQQLQVEVIRAKKPVVKTVPVVLGKNNKAQLGLYIRNETQGVGTITYINPSTLGFGALGHIVTDMHTRKPVEMADGTILNAKIESVQKSSAGKPGGKIALFSSEEKAIGEIRENVNTGIYGNVYEAIRNPLFDQPLDTASKNEIQPGKAEILTVIKNHQIEAFEIEIVHLDAEIPGGGRGMMIKVTDQRLLDETGGIIQGMSGSPVIQNDKIAGAVSHVLIHDPHSGYALFIDDMLKSEEKVS
ncbi:SpoIVB peptidase [Jeotgalibacillus sp. R-1-5s-1]|uniref:SpoIVB peptidase n=1 Tax=Jeotgalibacillus sp. R-1-5s-1 TaxID=2555897 RepID=UPI00141BEF21|nr:SpoIVB peptidase [Jeotgalibacillus sp. R-1-5s-1]